MLRFNGVQEDDGVDLFGVYHLPELKAHRFERYFGDNELVCKLKTVYVHRIDIVAVHHGQ